MAVLTETSPEGFNLGMVTAIPPHMLPAGAARYLQDVFVHNTGLTLRRGPLESVAGMVSFTKPISGLVATYNPLGTYKVAALEGDASNGYLSVLSSDYSAKTQIPFDSVFPTAPYRIVDAKPCLGGGVWISVATQYDGSPTQYLVLWHGADKITYTTGSCTVAQGSTTVTGSGTAWAAGAAAGSFLFDASGHFVGTVKSVDSDTTLTLKKPALVAISAASYSLKPLRGLNPHVAEGRLTTTTAATAVTGTNTRFVDQALGTGTWDLYRLSDHAYIGTVSAVTSNTDLTLAANAAIALTDELYFGVQRDGDYGTTVTSSKPGFLTATYARRQWYADSVSARIYPSDPDDAEAVNLVDGFIPITSAASQTINASLKNIVPTLNSLLVLQETEAHAVFGDDVTNFDLRRVADDGTLSAMSVQLWGGGVIYAGRTGIYFYDGQGADNITLATLGDYYKKSVHDFDPSTHRMWSAVVNDYYFLFIEAVNPPVPVIKGNVSTVPSRITIGVYMPTKAVGTYTNLHIRGCLTPPTTSGDVWIAANDSTRGWICDANNLFDEEGVDVVVCDGGTAGPDGYVRSRSLDYGDAMRKKVTKQFAMEYAAAGDSLLLDHILDLNDIAVTDVNEFPPTQYTWASLGRSFGTWATLGSAYPTWASISSNLYLPKRIRFRKTGHHYAFVLYQKSAAVTSMRVGPWALWWKAKRPGAV